MPWGFRVSLQPDQRAESDEGRCSDRNKEYWVWGLPVASPWLLTVSLGLGSLGGPWLTLHCFPGSCIYAFRLPEPQVPQPGQPSAPESGPRLGQDAFCQVKGDRLHLSSWGRSPDPRWGGGPFNEAARGAHAPANAAPGRGSPRPLPPQRPGQSLGPHQQQSPSSPWGCSRAPAGLSLVSAGAALCSQPRAPLDRCSWVASRPCDMNLWFAPHCRPLTVALEAQCSFRNCPRKGRKPGELSGKRHAQVTAREPARETEA